MTSDQASVGGVGDEQNAQLGAGGSAEAGDGQQAEDNPVALPPRDLEPQGAALGAPPTVVSPPAGGELDLPPPDSVPRPQVMAAPKPFPPPRVEDLFPSEGSVLGNTKITLLGANLLRESIVRFGGTLATPIGAHGGRELRVQPPPADRAGEVEVTVQNPGSDPVAAPQRFRYLALAPPRLSSVAPKRGPVLGGSELSVIGEAFVPETVVLFDGQEVAGAKYVDSRTIEIRTPPGAAGKLVDVAVRNPDGKTAIARRAFMYDERYR